MSEQISTDTLQTFFEIDPKEIPKESIVDDRFEIYGLLARSAVSHVYGAHDTKDNDINVALKIHSNPDPDTQLRSFREKQILEGLSHPNVVSLVASGLHDSENGSNPYIAMEYLALGTLSSKYNRQSTEQILEYLAGAASGLSYIHKQGILHRDIKPNNILVGGRGAKLGDLGLAIHESDRSWDPLYRIAGDREVKIFGTPGYVAPEIFHGELSTPKSDIYSLGSCAVAALVGEDEWRDEIATKVGKNVDHIATKRILQHHPEAFRVIHASLDEDPGKRPDIDSFIEVITARIAPELKTAA